MRRWRAAGVACMAVICCLAVAASCKRQSVAADEQYRRALTLLRSGEFDRAHAEAEAAERDARVLRNPEMRCRFRLLRIEALLDAGNNDHAERLVNAPPDPLSPEYAVRVRLLRARRAILKSDFESATTLTAEAQASAKSLSRPDLEAEASIQMGNILGRQRQYDRAEAMFQAGLASAITAGDLFRQGSATNNLALLRMFRSQCDAAIPLFAKGESLWRAAGAPYWAAIARGNAGFCYGQLGDYDKSLTLRRESIEQRRPGVHKANALGEMGSLYLGEEPRKAIPYYRQARDMARQFGAQPDAARWAGNLTYALAAVGDWAGAERALAEAIALRPESRSRAFLDLSAAEIALGFGRVDQSRTLYKRILETSAENPVLLWSAHAGAAKAAMAAGDTSGASRHFESAIHVIENAWAELNADEYKITFLGGLIRFYQDYVDALMQQGQTEKALAIADRSRARLLAQRLSRNIPHTPMDFRTVARQSGSTWIYYWLAPRRSFAWVITPATIQRFALPPAAEIEKLVQEYRGFIESAMRDPLATPSESGRVLYEKLIAPAAASIPKDADIVIVPDGALHQLSFDTIPVYSQTTAPHYLVTDYTIAVAPSVGVYRPNAARRGIHEALIIGDPISPGPEFPPLPYAPVEIAAVQKRVAPMKTTVLTREAARADVWKSADPGRYSLIHIAAHAEANEKTPLLSAIVLSPSPGFRLLARDLMDVPLRADLVTISACRSSGARSYRGEGLVGFAWAFLQAGSRSVIAGLWDVADESTSILMDRLYEGVARRESPARALRSARLALQKTGWSKPYYWGPFQCYIR